MNLPNLSPILAGTADLVPAQRIFVPATAIPEANRQPARNLLNTVEINQ
jgi:hypothetical protein